MSENVKIVINEIDNTSPASSGIDSTDIPFIPGFSILDDAPTNVPTLVTSVRDFERLFGSTPKKLTNRDVSKYPNYGFRAGDPDRSYVYAKELLHQGMPVVYANLVNEESLRSAVNINDGTAEFEGPDNTVIYPFAMTLTGTPKFDQTNPQLSVSKTTDTKTKVSSICIRANTNYAGAVTCEFFANVTATKNSITTFEPRVLDNSSTVVASKIDIDKTKSTNNTTFVSSYVKYSDTQVDFKNNTESDETICVAMSFELSVNLNEGETLQFNVQNLDDSIVDVFYSTKPVIETLLDDNRTTMSNVSIVDKSVYSVKYITSGGYPSVIFKEKATDVFATKMMAAAQTRGDAVAIIDIQESPDKQVFGTGNTSNTVYAELQSLFGGDSTDSTLSFGTAMYPWALYNCRKTLSEESSTLISMPASFGYLMCLAKTIKTSPNWLAIAGVTRGIVPSIQKLLVPNNIISNWVAEEMQPKFGREGQDISINTITNIRPYGLTLWGNRTLLPLQKDKGTTALNFLNTRNMISDVKKLLYTTAKACMFEPDSEDLWLKFKDGVRPLLDKLKAGSGISDYKIIRGTTKYNGDPLTKGEISAVVQLYPMYGVEYFELTVEINDEEVTVD